MTSRSCLVSNKLKYKKFQLGSKQIEIKYTSDAEFS